MRPLALSVAALAVACGGSTPAPQPPTDVHPAPSASSAPVASSEPAPPPDPRAQPWTPPDSTNDEQVKETCEPIIKVFERAKIQNLEEARALLADMEKDPPPIPSAQWAWCKDRLTAILDRKAKSDAPPPRPSEEAEAYNALGQIAKDMAAAYERETLAPGPVKPNQTATVVRKLCPSAKPVPAKLDDVTDKKYQSKRDEWHNDKGWACLKFDLDLPQLWQYEVKADATKFTAIARRKSKGELIELSIGGKVDAKAQVLSIDSKISESKKPAK